MERTPTTRSGGNDGACPSALLCQTRWPIRPHLRPRHRCELVTEADVRPEILRRYPNVVAELNCCPIDIWEGQGRPGRGWDGWRPDRIPLDEAIALPFSGEA